MTKTRYTNVYHLLNADKVEQAKMAFAVYPEEETADYFLTLGIIEQRYQNWKQALNAFSRVLEIEPENMNAKNNIHFIHNILNFWNPEMFNP